MKKGSMNSLFECLIKNMHNSEQDILNQLEVLLKLVKGSDFKSGIKHHITETKNQIKRLEHAFEILKLEKEQEGQGFLEKGKEILEKGGEIVSNLAAPFIPKSPAIRGIVKEGKEVFDKFEDTEVHDLVLSAGVQSIEMGEIAAYETLCQLAEACGYEEILKDLLTTLKEEGNQAKAVSQITEDELKRLRKAS